MGVIKATCDIRILQLVSSQTFAGFRTNGKTVFNGIAEFLDLTVEAEGIAGTFQYSLLEQCMGVQNFVTYMI